MNIKILSVIVLLFSFTALKSMQEEKKKTDIEPKQIKKPLCMCCGCEEVDHVKKLHEDLTAYYFKKMKEGQQKTAVSN